MEGWISVHRKLADNHLWLCEPFTRGQAWVDMLMLANHADSFYYVRNIKVNIKRGQLGWSEPKLAERWKWSRTKVRKFLKDLEKEQQIIQHKNNVTQILTIVNYEQYQKKEQQLIQQKDSKKTARKQQENVNDNDNKDNNEKINTSDYELVKNQFNAICKKLPSVSALNDKRKSAIKKLLFDYSQETIAAVFKKANDSNFLTGATGTWRANFDFVIKADNFLKIQEGNYSNIPSPSHQIRNSNESISTGPVLLKPLKPTKETSIQPK